MSRSHRERRLSVKLEKHVESGPSAGVSEDSTHEESAELPAASGLLTHIQSAMEHQKALLARELHDELGGLLVGAVMDLAWAEQHVSAPPAELRSKLTRARQALSSAIDLKRKLIEDLRPTLLDNVGLFAALRWHLQSASTRAGFSCLICVPDEERRFLPNIPIVLFRIAQEGLAVIAARKPVAAAEFNLTIDRRRLVIELSSSSGGAATVDAEAEAEAHYLAAIEQRVASLGGEFKSQRVSSGGTHMRAQFPLRTTLVPA